MKPIPLSFTTGLDRTRSPLTSAAGALYQLIGFRQDPTSFGDLKQTPYYATLIQRGQGTYYNGGSLTEPATSAVVATTTDLASSGGTMTITDYCVWSAAGPQVKCFYQTVIPAANTLNTQCFIVINSVAGLGITLGSTLDIVIDAATTFKWRKNGGAYTTGLGCSTTGTAIDSGNATVYFMTSSGFNVSDTWSWTRTDWSTEAATGSLGCPLQSIYFQSDMYYIGSTSRVMKTTVDGTGVQYVISAGYRPLYALGLESFYNHLVLICYATTSLLTQTSKVVAWSDVLDFNIFFSTDINEADTYTIPEAATTILKGVCVIRDTLFILTSGRVYYTNYLGLPTVFSFAPYLDLPLGTQYSSTLYTGDICVAKGSKLGVYVTGEGLIYLFNGSTFTEISLPLSGSSMVVYSIHYITSTKELWVRDGNGLIFVYQERFGTWYTRYAQYDNSSSAPVAVTSIAAGARLGISSRKTLAPDISGLVVLLPDYGGGTSFGVPTITTSIITGGSFSYVKEISGTFLAASGSTNGNYSTTILQLSWIVCNDGKITGTVLTDSNATWTTTATTGQLSYPRIAFRGLALQITLTNSATPTKPPGRNFTLSQLELTAVDWPQPPAVK